MKNRTPWAYSVMAGVALMAMAWNGAFAQPKTTTGSPFQKPEKAVKYRQSVMSVMAHHFGQLGAVVNGKVPLDIKSVRENAALVATLARLPWPAFTEDTKNLATHTHPDVWAKPQGFKKGADDLIRTTAALETLAQAATGPNDLAKLKAAFGDAAQTCKACHKAYEKE